MKFAAVVAATACRTGSAFSTAPGSRAALRAAPAILAAATAMRARRPVVGGNWKCNPEKAADLDGLIANIQGCGAFTGEMAVEQMKDMGISQVLIGHSERREYFKESDEMLATKLKYILDAGMKCVFCIGEKLPEREKGMEATMAVCIQQMEQVKGLLDPAKVVIA